MQETASLSESNIELQCWWHYPSTGGIFLEVEGKTEQSIHKKWQILGYFYTYSLVA